MKSLLFIGATLMIGAGIYGFVDYKKKNQSKEFKSLYREKAKTVPEQPAPAAVTPAATIVATATEKKETVVEKKKEVATKAVKRKHKKFNSKQFSRAALEEEFADEVRLPEPEPVKKELQ